VHLALRTIAARRAALDADEARWLREADAIRIWRRLGMVNAIDYMERVLGYGPRAAKERLRVARALGSLPMLERALSEGEMAFSAVRELSRVVIPRTEAAWIDAARGKNLRQLEELVAGHRPGDLPDDPADPSVRPRIVKLELTPEAYALFRQASAAMNDEYGRHLDDSDLVTALVGRALEGRAGEPTGRAKYQVAITLCARCRQGWQDGGGATVAIDTAAVERAECDAQRIGSIDGDGPARASQDITPAVARFVWRRDHGRCRVPGCRSSRCLELHHIQRRIDGGTHDARNLILLCDSCHRAHHERRLDISGTADNLEVRRPAELHGRTRRAEGAHVGTSGQRTPDSERSEARKPRRRRNEAPQSASPAHHRPDPSKAWRPKPDPASQATPASHREPDPPSRTTPVERRPDRTDEATPARSEANPPSSSARSDARDALTRMGYKKKVARRDRSRDRRARRAATRAAGDPRAPSLSSPRRVSRSR
jgi:hypothetical protein